jgi:hypothetical protein
MCARFAAGRITSDQRLRQSWMDTADDSMKDKTSDIVKIIVGLANRESNDFRTVIGKTGKSLIALRDALPIEEYLARVASQFR